MVELVSGVKWAEHVARIGRRHLRLADQMPGALQNNSIFVPFLVNWHKNENFSFRQHGAF
jgi:hypothetical protein